MLNDLELLRQQLRDPSHYSSLDKLRLRVEHLATLSKSAPVRRSKVKDMSAEVVDSNPYSRLMALQRMGIVENYERIREFSVAIVVCTFLLMFCPLRSSFNFRAEIYVFKCLKYMTSCMCSCHAYLSYIYIWLS